jgi:hypothetical protein
MPYLLSGSSSDSRSVHKEFDPEITPDHWRQLAGAPRFPLTPEGRAGIPKRLRILRGPSHGPMPHILGWSTGPWIVSPRVRDLIEELEPGVQQFSPLELARKSGKEVGTYFLLLPPVRLDAVVPEKSDLSDGRPIFMGRLVLDADMIRGHHLWRGEGPLVFKYFCSDELRDRLKNEKLDGWDLRRRCTAEPR